MRKTGTESKRNRSVLVAEGVVKSIQSLKREGTRPTFNAVLAYLKSRGILSNHRSLRVYLDSLAVSGLLNIREETAKKPNIRPKQVYSLTSRGPFIEAGEKALIFHGLNWTIPVKSSIKLKTDLEGVVRGRLDGGTLYGSLEDAVVENLARLKVKGGLGGSSPSARPYWGPAGSTKTISCKGQEGKGSGDRCRSCSTRSTTC